MEQFPGHEYALTSTLICIMMDEVPFPGGMGGVFCEQMVATALKPGAK